MRMNTLKSKIAQAGVDIIGVARNQPGKVSLVRFGAVMNRLADLYAEAVMMDEADIARVLKKARRKS